MLHVVCNSKTLGPIKQEVPQHQCAYVVYTTSEPNFASIGHFEIVHINDSEQSGLAVNLQVQALPALNFLDSHPKKSPPVSDPTRVPPTDDPFIDSQEEPLDVRRLREGLVQTCGPSQDAQRVWEHLRTRSAFLDRLLEKPKSCVT